MALPCRLFAPAARRSTLALAGILALLPALAGAFVTLDTSAASSAPSQSPAAADSSARSGAVRDSADTTPGVAPAGTDPVPATRPEARTAPANPPARPHFRTVLFLSADNMLVYAYLGALKALEEFKVEPDLVVVEGKAVVVGAAWALDYRSARVEEKLLERPLSGYLTPHRQHGNMASRFTPFGPDPIQIEVPLSLQSLQAPDLQWNDAPSREGDEYLHLSWMVAKLTHDAPGGPVEDLRDAPRPLAVQVADLDEERGKVLMEGNLQSLLKAGLLPAEAVRRRKRLWPYAPGTLLSGQALLPAGLPFTYDRLIVIQPSRHLRPPSLEERAEPWRDSLEQKFRIRSASAAGGDGDPSRGAGNVLRIELNPDPGFDNGSRDPKAWMDLGYASTLRSMDVLISTLGRAGADGAAERKGSGRNGAGAGKQDRGSSAGSTPAPALPPPLGLDRLTVNPLASGGRQLLQDLVRQSADESGDSSGEAPISDLVRSGYYSDLDVEWVPSPAGELPALVFDAREKSRLLFQAAANAANAGEDLPDRGPEVYSALIWSEPFYVPFRAEGAILLGGHRPGYSGRFLVEPIYPMHLEIGISRKDWRIRFPVPPTNTLDLVPFAFRADRRRSEIFLNLLPFQGLRLSTAIQKHEMTDRTEYEAEDPDSNDMEPQRKFESTDFQQTGFLGLGQPGASGVYRHSLWLRYRNLNRENLFGPVKYSFSSLEARVRLSLGDFRIYDQYYWSDKDVEDLVLFDYMESGEISAYSFQDEFFYSSLRAPHFQNVQAEYAPTLGKFGLRLLAGGFQTYGRSLNPFLGVDFSRWYWEAQVSYATPVGPLRAGLAGLEDDSAIYFIRIGADLDLDRDGPED